MKMFRPVLAAVLSTFVSLTWIPLNARSASTLLPSGIQTWFSGQGHIWREVGTLFSGVTSATARVDGGFPFRELSFEDRVAYQRAIEEVYWRHRIWPRDRGERPPLDAVMSQTAIEKKVQDYLRESESLEEEWQTPITPERLQAEMERMAQHTRQPEVLRELFAALGNDPFVIAECLARSVLLERLQFATAEGRQERLESWSAKEAQNQLPNAMTAANANYTLPAISDQPGDCTDDTWTPTSLTNAPDGRTDHTAVWTGSEMIVWGGNRGGGFTGLNTGGRYNPSTDSWTATTTTNAPQARLSHTAVWTGTEMIVWGGQKNGIISLNTGGRYNPGTDSWTATSTTDAPVGRHTHTAIWTGSEMIVWGGFFFDGTSHCLDTGGRYNPGTDSWAATSTTNAPTGRNAHTAVWTGSEMIVWGGLNCGSSELNSGGRYDPGTDSWTATSTTNAPERRAGQTAVWTGSEMIIWGGNFGLDTGGRYNPGTDSWAATSITDAPAGRYAHTAVWTGSEMIVWGGRDSGNSPVNTGGRYKPSTDSWTATSTANAPRARSAHTAVWAGSEMIVWSGNTGDVFTNTGGRYCAQAGEPITLDAGKRKMEGINTVRLKWREATSTDIDVYRDGTLIATTPNDGTYIDSTGDTGRARYTYQVCEAGAQACSNEVTVTFTH
jgi:N-acetylneuraminic acid mutarotase